MRGRGRGEGGRGRGTGFSFFFLVGSSGVVAGGEVRRGGGNETLVCFEIFLFDIF